MECITYMSVFLVLLVPGSLAINTFYMDSRCNEPMNHIDISKYGMSTIRLRLTSRSTYRPNMHCILFLTTDPMSKLMFHFQYLAIEDSATCSRDWLEVRDGNLTTSPFVSGIYSRLCGSAYSSYGYSTSTSRMTLVFVSDSTWGEKGFDMIITSYHKGGCDAGEYECSNHRCINDDITCNGYNPCNDHSDCPLTGGVIAAIVIGSFVFLVVLLTIVIVCRRRRRRHMTYRHVDVTPVMGQQPTPGYGTGGYNQPPAAYPYPQGQQYPPS